MESKNDQIEKISSFEELNKINVNEYTEKKEGLTYLTWSSAWAELKKIYPNATYNIKKFDNNLPYVYDENTGYMVFTDVTIENLTYEMWLPVMDMKNKAMKNYQYTYTTKYGEKTVEPATMFDINKTIMRCLVKNLAMFGLGLYIYAGEDLPEGEEPEPKKIEPKTTSKIIESQIKIIKEKLNEEQIKKALEMVKREKLEDMTVQEASSLISKIK